jgi:hypothetical protein
VNRVQKPSGSTAGMIYSLPEADAVGAMEVVIQ